MGLRSSPSSQKGSSKPTAPAFSLDRPVNHIVRNLPSPSSSLVLAFRGAHQKQEEQLQKLEQQIARMQAQQAEELMVLAAAARALEKPGTPQPGQTFL